MRMPGRGDGPAQGPQAARRAPAPDTGLSVSPPRAVRRDGGCVAGRGPEGRSLYRGQTGLAARSIPAPPRATRAGH